MPSDDGTEKVDSTGDDTPSDSSGEASAPLPPPPSSQIDPLDFETNVGTTIPTITVYREGLVIDAVALENLRAATFLATWPELASIAAEVRLEEIEGNTWRIVTTATLPLENRWHVLAVRPWPNGIREPHRSGMIDLPDEGYGARFRPDSDPRVWGTYGCNKSSTVSSFYLYFSEPVSGDFAALVSIESCDPPVAQGRDPLSSGDLFFRCPALHNGDTIVVNIEAGLESPVGSPLVDGNGKTAFSWSVPIEFIGGSQCWQLRAPEVF